MKKSLGIFMILATLLLLSRDLLLGHTKNQSSNSNGTGDIKAVDSNGDGIWDDVEPFLKSKEGDPVRYQAIRLTIKVFQMVVKDPDLGKKWAEAKESGKMILDPMEQAADCTFSVGMISEDDDTEIENAVLTNPARIRAYVRYNANAKGSSAADWDEETMGDVCDDSHLPL